MNASLPSEHDDLARLYSQWSTKRLVTAIDRDADQYAPHALTVMRSVLNERRIPPGDLDALIAAVRAERRDERLRRAGFDGWQLVFIVSLFLGVGLLMAPPSVLRPIASGIFLLFGRRFRAEKDEDSS